MEMFPPDYYQTDQYRPYNEIMLPSHNRPLPFVTNDRECPAIDDVMDIDKHREDIFKKDSSKDVLWSSAWDDSSTQNEIPSLFTGVGMPQWVWP